MIVETSVFNKVVETGKHGIVFGIGSTLTTAIGFFLIPIYTTHFSAADYGIFGLIVISGNVLTSVFTLGIPSAFFRSYFDYDDELRRKSVISTALFILLISCSVLLLAMVFLSPHLSTLIFGSEKFDRHLLVITVIAAFGVLNTIPLALFRARKKSALFVTFQTLMLIVGLSVIIYLVTVLDQGVMGALTGKLVVSALTFICYFISIRKEFSFSISIPEAKAMLHFGLPLLPSALSVFLFNFADRFMLNYYTTLDDVGLYNLAYQMGMILLIVFVTPISLIWPTMIYSVKNQKNAMEYYRSILTYTAFVGIFLFLLVSILSRDFIKSFSNEEYWAAYTVVPFIALSYVLLGNQQILNVGIGIHRKTKYVALYNGVGAIVNICLNVVLIPSHGYLGAGYATLISFAIMILLAFSFNRRLIQVKYEWTRILKIMIAGSILFGIGYNLVIDDVLYSVIVKILVVFTFPLVLYVMRFYTSAEIMKARHALIKILPRMSN